jgi:hypothetical protein
MRGTTRKLTKSDFVRSLSADMPAKQVVAAAIKQGIKGLTERYVYVIRSSDKARARSGRPPAGEGRRRGRGGGNAEATLRRAIAELGLARAREVFRDVEKAFAR